MIFFNDLSLIGNHAGFKAKYDALKIAEKNNLDIKTIPLSIKGFWGRIISSIRLSMYLLSLSSRDRIIFNYPLAKPYNFIILVIMRLRNFKSYFLVHDVDSLRGHEQKRNNLLTCAQGLIVHNERMFDLLLQEGIEPQRMVNLGIFDYLIPEDDAYFSPKTDSNCAVVVAGNLSPVKARYLYDWNPNFNVFLFGINLSAKVSKMMSYRGVFDSNDPSELLKLDDYKCYGLVWDGDSVDTCSGNYGEYLRFNNPHKLSLYLTLGIPVIVWKESALSSYVELNNCGFSISSLNELDFILNDNKEYYKHIMSAKNIGRKLRVGDYLSESLKKLI
ncbi:hypothetical protein LPW36_01790 [Jinshanibacter sp. LJY008]|uniref:Beta-1,6-galactofuranosyltransferase n=1 Tax=Limnobaculum eriocheiris TaxID=2897391 RepID=A0A9X1SNB4_9GAMM|nr:hypothetical protein [Limnobaculum eriocheiris]MCD1124777.1 hypothetical protein [Limnobaculum eriocheiris]